MPKLFVVSMAVVLFLTSTAATKARQLEFHLAEREASKGLTPMRVDNRTGFIYVHPEVLLDDRDIENAAVVKTQQGAPAVQVKLTPDGRHKMVEITHKYQGKTIAILSGGKVVSAPVVIGEQIDDLLDIEGAFTPEEAQFLATALRPKNK